MIFNAFWTKGHLTFFIKTKISNFIFRMIITIKIYIVFLFLMPKIILYINLGLLFLNRKINYLIIHIFIFLKNKFLNFRLSLTFLNLIILFIYILCAIRLRIDHLIILILHFIHILFIFII